jgi:hypothetical protein
MKSKAQQFVDYLQPKVPVVYRPEIGVGRGFKFVVSDVGECLLANTSIVFSSQEALALRDWLTDTFDESPADPIEEYVEPVMVEVWAVKSSKSGKLICSGGTKSQYVQDYKGCPVKIVKLREVTDEV